ncbi:MAG: 2TM domain-containing protein [Chloroflexi bacterium]|nr:2TM domain-containing protein [Chloroflexota bacterium]
MPVKMSEEEMRQIAERRVAEKKGFFIHLVVYITVNAFLVGVWAMTNGLTNYSFPWFIYPMAGWGIGLIFHFLAVFVFPKRGGEWERREIQKEIEKLKKE